MVEKYNRSHGGREQARKPLWPPFCMSQCFSSFNTWSKSVVQFFWYSDLIKSTQTPGGWGWLHYMDILLRYFKPPFVSFKMAALIMVHCNKPFVYMGEVERRFSTHMRLWMGVAALLWMCHCPGIYLFLRKLLSLFLKGHFYSMRCCWHPGRKYTCGPYLHNLCEFSERCCVSDRDCGMWVRFVLVILAGWDYFAIWQHLLV